MFLKKALLIFLFVVFLGAPVLAATSDIEFKENSPEFRIEQKDGGMRLLSMVDGKAEINRKGPAVVFICTREFLVKFYNESDPRPKLQVPDLSSRYGKSQFKDQYFMVSLWDEKSCEGEVLPVIFPEFLDNIRVEKDGSRWWLGVLDRPDGLYFWLKEDGNYRYWEP